MLTSSLTNLTVKSLGHEPEQCPNRLLGSRVEGLKLQEHQLCSLQVVLVSCASWQSPWNGSTWATSSIRASSLAQEGEMDEVDLCNLLSDFLEVNFDHDHDGVLAQSKVLHGFLFKIHCL